ncbi:MAG: NAD-dependent DNA ligase LigA [Deltaproteobacteria bacterium]|nr:NAD-dependent DNA ligase LigA [Deltaproteobacteria bacterium]
MNRGRAKGSDPAAAEEDLAAQLRRHRELYYRGEPEISDAEFDALEDRLRALNPQHPVLAEVGAPPPSAPARSAEAQLGGDVDALARELVLASNAFYDPPSSGVDLRAVARRYRALWEAVASRAPGHPLLEKALIPEGTEWPKARHEIPMGSLNKVNTEEDLAKWAERCDELAAERGLPKISRDLCLTEKLDGLSIEVVFSDGAPEHGITRGDGEVGERITSNVLRMRGVPPRIPDRRRLSFRGEIVLLRSLAPELKTFKEQARGAVGEISLRNTAAGLARANKPDVVAGARFLSVFFYDVEGVEGLITEAEKLAFIREQGLLAPGTVFGPIERIVEEYRAYAGARRQELPYEIDGLVVRANHLDAATLLGDLNNRPRAAVAFKFENEMQVSRLKEILWQTGDTGRITPVGNVEPVRLAGATIENASLHNWANVQRLGIGVGDEVLVSRRNDVIPYIEKVVVKRGEPARAPSHCATCGQPVTTEGEYLICKNAGCPARRVGRLRTWVRQLDLNNWGDKTLVRLDQEGLAHEPADLYRLEVEDLTALEGFAEISAKKLLDPLEEKKRIPLDTFIAALGVESVSTETARLLVRAGYDSIARIANASVEELAAIPGLGEIKAARIREGLAARLAEVDRLAEVGVVPVPPTEGGPLAGLSFCFSGSHGRPRKELQAIVEDNGGRVATSVTKGVNYLVLADASSTSSKAQKARQIGTEVIDEATFERLVQERGGHL